MDFNFILSIVIATATAVAYFHLRIEIVKKDIIKELEDELKDIEKTINQNIMAHKNLYVRYVNRGEKIRTAFSSVRERFIKFRSEFEGLYQKVYDIRNDVDDLYKKGNLTRRDCKVEDYQSYRSSTSTPDFDTMGDVDITEIEQESSV